MAADYITFLKELPESFKQIGGVIPSSPFLGRDMVRPIREAQKRKGALRILEVGPGTGPFTRQILKLMKREDTLLVCEINPRFIADLKDRLQDNKHYLSHKDRMEFFEGPVQNLAKFNGSMRFDVIVSSLPFSLFSPDTVREVLELFNSMLLPEGTLTFCEYVGLRKISELVSSPENKIRVKAIERVMKDWHHAAEQSGRIKKTVSLLNLPPAFTIRYDAVHTNGKSARRA